MYGKSSRGAALFCLAFAATACTGQITSVGSSGESDTSSSVTTPEVLADADDEQTQPDSGGGLSSSSSSGSTSTEGGSTGSGGSNSSGFTTDDDDNGTATVPDLSVETDVFALEMGDCFDSLAIDEVQKVDGLSCEASHLYEVYAAFDVPDGDFPGEDAIVERAQEGCLDAFAPFVGISYDDSFLEVSYLYPTRESWTLGNDREILCLVVNLDETPRIGTAKGSAI